ncbi:methyl-accepting chemotaxis protein [Paenibacillus sp. MCAF20]
MINWFRRKLIGRILVVMAAVIVLIVAGNSAIQLHNTGTAVEGAISTYNMNIAQNYVTQIDVDSYADFIQDPQENERYWKLREELDRFRLSIGARYVYFVKVEADKDPLLLIDGRPKGDPLASPINEVTDMPASAIKLVLDGQAASSDLIDNPEYGTYISAFVPMLAADGTFIGALGIDTDASVLHQLTNEVTIGSAYEAMLLMSGHLNDKIGDIVSKIAHTSDVVAYSSETFSSHADQILTMGESVSGSIRHIHEGAYAQTQSAQDNAVAMEEMTQGIIRISESSATVSDAAVQALHTAQTGQTTINEMNRQMLSISETAQETLTIAKSLQHYTSEIEGSLGAISEFANQTKLLALNASIEAARAGEHGRGFTVVAAEVRKLAEASDVTVRQVTALLGNISKETGRISEQMDLAASEIGTGARLSQEAEQAFIHAVSAFHLVTDQIMEVSSTVEQMSAGSEEVAATVSTMASVAGGVSEQTKQIQELTELQLEMIKKVYDDSIELKSNTSRMREAISQVKV